LEPFQHLKRCEFFAVEVEIVVWAVVEQEGDESSLTEDLIGV
jgi:hypothetical protein